jgi:hypothetical protein
MRTSLPLFTVLAVTAAAAMAQTTAPTQPAPATAEKPKTVTKVVCDRIISESETGSRLGTTPKKCRKVEVPVKESSKDAHGSGHPANAF